jgi:cytochrome c556
MEVIMVAFKPRTKDGFGLGATPGAILPDYIEKKIIDLATKRPLTAAVMGKEAAALEEMAYRTAAVGNCIDVHAPKAAAKAATWKGYTAEMRKGALELADAAKKKDANAVKAAANKLNASCTNCHSDFRD